MNSFWLGALGAAAPEAIRLFKVKARKLNFPLQYFVITLLFVAVGGAITYALIPTGNPAGALYMGSTFPTLISSFANRARTNGMDGSSDVEEIDVGGASVVGHYIREYLATLWS